MTSIKSKIIEIDRHSESLAEESLRYTIEATFKKLGIDPIRWAIVEANETKLKISVSY